MISFVYQPRLPLDPDERAVLQDPTVAWAQLLAAFPTGLLDKIARRYYAAEREFNKRRRRGRPGRPRSRRSAERQAALAREQAQGAVVGPEDFIPLGPEARPATTGRSPKSFHAMVLAFLATGSDDAPAVPEHVDRRLHGNPTFASRCGFEYPARPEGGHSRRDTIPSLRTLQRFDQVMAEYGLWSEIRLALVRRNLESGALARSSAFCADTSHFEADSSSRAVELPLKKHQPAPPKQRKVVAERAAHNKKPKEVRKVRISSLTKRCRHQDHEACNCPWVEADPGAGVVVKSSTKVYWAHKGAVIGFAGASIPLDIAVVKVASMHDSTTLEPHLERLRRLLPEAFEGVGLTIADPAYDEAPARERLPANHDGMRLLTEINPRARKEAPLPGHEGRFRLSPKGVPICLRKKPLCLLGRDKQRQEYLWAGPVDAQGTPLCKACPFAAQCGLRGQRRALRVPRTITPQIDWNHPQHLPREQTRYRLRTAIERQIERVKGPLERNRLPCRGLVRVQSFLDLRLAVLHAMTGFT
jgi:hypothetical protein